MNAATSNHYQGLLQRLNALSNGSAAPQAPALPTMPAVMPSAPATTAPVMPADQFQRTAYGFPMPAWGYFVGGQTGPEVASLQSHLIALGYLGGAPDALYAYGTVEAVRYFQMEYGLPITGTFDHAAYATMMAVFAGQLPRMRGMVAPAVQPPQAVPAQPTIPTQAAPAAPAQPTQPPQSNPLGLDWVAAPQSPKNPANGPLDMDWQTSKPPAAPQPAPKPQPKPEPAKPEPPKPSGNTTYTVRSGDTLSSIAQAVLGDEERWREIYDLNRDQISDSNVIHAGQVLKLPDGAKKPSTPSGKWAWPVSGRLTSPYGHRKHPISGEHKHHTGMDIGAPTGTPIHVPLPGTVSFAGWNGGYGNYVVVDHGNGLQTAYAHLSAINVRKGQSIGTRDVVGKVGSTGNSTGPHLHFEVKRNGQFIDPRTMLA